VKLKNPFIITGYQSPQYFCDRTKETKKIVSAIENQRNLTLFSLRRLGKTSLIHHVFYKLNKGKDHQTVYCDIMPTSNLSDFVDAFGTAVARKLGKEPIQFYKKLSNFFTKIRPQINFDISTGEPTLEFRIKNEREGFKSIEDIFNCLEYQSKKKYIVVAFDEFQQILNYPEKNVLALLRSKIQFLNKVNFIFSGSKKHMLLSIFYQNNMPFYRSTEFMMIDKIDRLEYFEFINRLFKENKIKVKDDDIYYILDWTYIHTYYTQCLCNKIYAGGSKVINTSVINEIMDEILKDYENIIYGYRELITPQQWQLLKAIGRERGISKPTGINFCKKYDLNGPSSIKRSLNALLDKDLIFEEKGTYYVYDVFLAKWFERI